MKEEYDVIIIGGGIGGLVCCSYLTKFGYKTLLIEKNDEVGGYCQSFSKDGYVFNSFIRGFVGAKSGGAFNKLLRELSLESQINLIRPEVYDTIQYLGKSIYIHQDYKRTIENIVNYYPREKDSIKNFFAILTDEDSNFRLFKYRNLSFQQLINIFFKNNELKFLMNILRIDSGKMPQETSAIVDLMLIKGNILDGGYFPAGGMGSIPKLFEDYIYKMGGRILKKSLVKKIIIRNNVGKGVITENDETIHSKVVVSNADATYTYLKLLKDATNISNEIRIIKNMVPSSSVFVMYLALKKTIKRYLKYKCSAIWNIGKSIGDGIICTLPSVVDPSMAPENAESVMIYYGAAFNNKNYWDKNKERFEKIFMNRFDRTFPGMSKDILFKVSLTPPDLENLTLNRCGSARGWSPRIQQHCDNNFPDHQTCFKNIFLVGHWIDTVYGNGGITFAAQTGRKVANMIYKDWGQIAK